jgi:tetratricopeptide (TPR) repeat protein
MSLLLDALRRAESDAQKSRSPADAPAETAPPVAAAPVEPYPEFTLEALAPGQDAPVELPELPHEALSEPMATLEPVKPTEAKPVFTADALDFVLPSDDPHELPKPAFVSSRNREALHPFDKEDEPPHLESNWGALTGGPSSRPASSRNFDMEDGPGKIFSAGKKRASAVVAEASSTDLLFSLPEVVVPQTPAPPRMAAPAPSRPIPMPTPAARSARQSLAAASIMAGSKLKLGFGKERRRQVILLAIAGVVALPVLAFLLFGNAFFGVSEPLVASRAPVAQPMPGVAPPVAAPEALAASAPAAMATPAPEVLVATAPSPVPPPVASAAPVVPVAPAAAPAVARPIEAAAQPRSRADTAAPARDPAPRSAVSKKTTTDGVSVASPSLVSSQTKPVPKLEAAYAAYQRGNPDEAVRLYQEVLKADPTQRDAWLGLAVIAHASNQREPAMDAYKRVLRLEPQNATALAGVNSLSSNAGEAQQESRLRELLARSPQEADLNHALALVLSGEQRWSEAQPLFFKAHTLAPQEPQFAYNLAVSLDHMRKSSLAAQYYQTALTLAQGKTPSFNESNARTRLAALRSGPSDGVAR